MHAKKALSIFLVGFVFSLAGTAQQTCTVQVTTKNIADGTLFYLKDSKTDLVYDSAEAMGNRFTLKASLDKEATQALVYEKDYKAYIFVWLAPGNLEIVQHEKTLRTAKVTGNELEAHASEFKKLLETTDKKIEQLEAQIVKEKSASKREDLIKAYEDLEKRKSQTERDYVRQYPNRLHSAFILDVYTTSWGADTTRALFDPFSESVKQTGFGRSIERFLTLVAPSGVGDMASDVRQPSPGGDTLLLSSFKGKWVLLEFWASWCGPCREDNPALVKTYKDFKNKNFEIFAVSLDKNADAWNKAIEKDGLKWPQVSELNGNKNSAALTYSVSGIPDNALINPQGKIVARGLRGKALRAFLNDNLK
jgi:thiol-disulfide isomerase/thioredoxin